MSTLRGEGDFVVPQNRKWRTPQEVSEEVGHTRRTVTRWCAMGIVPALQTSTGRWRIYASNDELEKARAEYEARRERQRRRKDAAPAVAS